MAPGGLLSRGIAGSGSVSDGMLRLAAGGTKMADGLGGAPYGSGISLRPPGLQGVCECDRVYVFVCDVLHD